ATMYRARIATGLTDTTGGVLEDDYIWEFTAIKPAVAATYPDVDTIYVSTEPEILVAFNQPMDHTSAEAAFELKNLATNQTVSGSYEWHEGGLVVPERHTYQPYQWSWSRGEGPERTGVETMVFTPDEPLHFSTAFRASLGSGAGSANGKAATETPYQWMFDTIEFPRIDATSPGNGWDRVDPWNGIEISFSSPMNPDSIRSNYTISPPISPTDVYTYWWDNNTQLEISFPIEPNSAYTVTLSGDIEGRYGQKLGTDTVIRWSTRGYDPIVYLNAPYRVGTHSAYTETLAYVTVRNLGRVNFALYQMSLGDFLRTNGSDSWEYWDEYAPAQSNLVREWTLETDPPVNQRRTYGTSISIEPATPLPPGIYYLQIEGDATSVYPEAAPAVMPGIGRQILVVSRHNVTLKTTPDEVLAWVTDLNSGQGEAQLPLILMDDQTNILANGSTDSRGLFFTESAGAQDRWTPIFAFVGNPDEPDDNFAVGISQWDDEISPWRFDLPMESEPDVYNTYVFTEKPIYRPGQPVYFKGIVRKDDDAHYSLPRPNTKVSITIYDGQNNKVYEEQLPVSEMGTWDGELTLGEDAALGIYSIDVEYQQEYFWGSFQVAEYRVPEFQVAVAADRPEYAQSETINVTTEASYFFGGPVSNAEVRYVVLSTDHYFNYQGPGWWDFVDYEYSRRGGGSYYGEQIAEGTGFTDGAGRFTFSIDADITENTASQRFTLEATVTDINNQEVSNRTEAIVHKGNYYIGLRPERYVGQVGRE
ncbi:MAG: Ig-like domain-containing protein, partial [Anaerolineae bacterium]|nr:Ig-like domain-containing protein [Anaerolineae bacterium]